MSDRASVVRPTIGRIVIYRGKRGRQNVRAALITCTVDTLDRAGVEAGEVQDLDSVNHVHLNVFTPSQIGAFVEFNVPMAEGAELQPGEWSWPPRV